ncbi:MAG: glycosyltransferase [Flavobacteriales bacterium]|nr:glycosyltransferase [Flavobacteriales bacterium]
MSKKKVFISPLDWGLGHATRCVPIIKILRDLNCDVIIGSDGPQLDLLRKEFPTVAHLKFPGYNINYPKNGNMTWHMLKSVRKIAQRIMLENQYVGEINEMHKLDGIISDNRYGLYNNDIPSVFITHQLNIQAPIGKFILKNVTGRFIRKYQECWVPDVKGEGNLSGKLSQNKPPENVKYVGPISRLNNYAVGKKRYDVMVIISGPEPQRTIFQNIIIPQLHRTNASSLVVLGQPDKIVNKTEGKVEIRSHLDSKQMAEAINGSNVIVSRPGYSTIMDLAQFGKKAMFIPTPGQTEQEFLAKYHRKLGHTSWQKQKDLNLKSGLEMASNYKGIPQVSKTNSLEQTVREFVNAL